MYQNNVTSHQARLTVSCQSFIFISRKIGGKVSLFKLRGGNILVIDDIPLTSGEFACIFLIPLKTALGIWP